MPLTLGSLAIVGLILLDGRSLVAQAKKDVKEAAAETSAEPAKKAEVKFIPQIPPIQDQMLTSNGAAQVSRINELVRANWVANKVNPSERCNDFEFIRRASLDIIGRIATEAEILEYMKQSTPTRRAWLVEKLLRSEECGENMANIWTVMLLTRTGSKKQYQQQLREWLTDEFNAKEGSTASTMPSPVVRSSPSAGPAPTPSSSGGVRPVAKGAKGVKGEPDWSKTVYSLLTATGKTNENAAVNFIAHHIGDEIRMDDSKKGRASPEELRENGRYDMVPVTSRTTRLFLGVRTQCVQCHDHPFNGELQQGQFWGINAFFRQTTVSQRPPMMAAKKNKKDLTDPNIELIDEPGFNQRAIVSYERRSGLLKYTGMQFLDGSRVKTLPEGTTRRAELAKFIVNDPMFAKSFANRMWAHFFGKSFTRDAADDFGEHNPVTNPELLDYLAEQFRQYDHNPKDLMRWICNSQAYGLSSKANRYNDKPDDEVLFARMLMKAMTPEQLFESLMTATASKVAGDKEQRRALREAWLDKLVLNFGNDEGEEGTFSGTVVQALMLMNGDDINKAITDQAVGTVANVIREKGLRITDKNINKLYLSALNRPATPAEIQRLMDPRMYLYHNPALKGKINTSSDAFAIGYYQDIYWALLNSNEFFLNH